MGKLLERLEFWHGFGGGGDDGWCGGMQVGEIEFFFLFFSVGR